MSLLEFTLQSYRRREKIEESSLRTATESDKKAMDKSINKKYENELSTPSNFDARMKNIFETIVELHLTICYPSIKVCVLRITKYNYNFEEKYYKRPR